LAIVILGIAIYLLGELSSLYILIEYAFLLVLFGLTWTLLGWPASRLLMVPLALLVFMIPLPDFLYLKLSSQLQLLSSELGVMFIRLFNISVYIEGNVIDLGSYKLQVVEACSGLRYLFPLASLAFISAYIFKAPFWKRCVVFISSVPITILMNSFRIGAIGVLVEYWGVAAAEGFLHDFEGWVIFLACTAILVAEMWLLTLIGDSRRPLGEVFGLDFPEPSPKDAIVQYRTVPRHFWGATASLVVTAMLVSFLGQRTETIPDRKTFIDFPATVATWEGKRLQLESIYIDALKLDDYILADYIDKSHKNMVNFYSAYYASQRKGGSAHSPRTCIPGGGWQITEITQKMIDGGAANVASFNVNRAIIQKGDHRQLVYYWFQQRGRNITNEYLVKWYIFWDALTRNRTDGALVRLITSVPPSSDLADADRLLSDFSRAVVVPLRDYVPE
jgi:exosortase D (VPLPA-CTERM-specific)